MPTRPPSTPTLHGDAAQAFGSAVAETWKSFSGLSLPPKALAQLQGDYLKEATTLWNSALERLQAAPGDKSQPLPDRRFAGEDWAANPAAAYLAQLYLLNARTMMQLAESLEGDEKTRQRVRFAVQQWIDAASPSNFLALNPEALRKALETQGQSIAQGMQMLLKDLQQGHVSQTDTSVFEVGRNVATTEGAVVFENDLIQLIEYKPLTAKVHEKPFLFVPPCINKYYILDLQPDNSFIRYTVEQGHRTFVISWRNPDESLAHKTWDDYIEEGPIAAIRAVQAITGQKAFDMLGFCVGGTILATALAVLAARGEQPASSLTLLTTLLDFSHTGILDVFVDEASVQLREMTIGPDAPGGPKLLKGRELATTFSFLRPNDLVWNYVVGNYLKGESPPPFDLLYWNGDSTNLPGPMYCWYLRHTYLQDELKIPGRLTTCGEKIDLGKIKAPVFIYASREDHIVPWESAYKSTALLKGKKRFVLGASGHIAGVINPPAKGKRSHWVNDALPASAHDWLAGAKEVSGSWWPDWAAWVKPHAGKLVPAPKTYGGHGYKAIEPAPGRYVKQKA
ncbi:class I poly(R)-hydroxyalkanoic acid synthase [Azohydromonas sediminis]|uniref:class I poly(R)-hydroxyalkanoic acid synthase n=1 Tax=Azohydromonas sediminis TaxID=2259674 RepID=UPI000E651946|nr:class I poly(R)-hydroxyalkanoic acid synthase [Azohydromonas sediminis]